MSRSSRAAIVAALALLSALITATPAVAASSVPSPHPVTKPTTRASTAAEIRASTGDDAIEVPGASEYTRFAHKTSATTHRMNALASGSSDGVERVWVSVASVTSKSSDDVNTAVSQANVASLISALNSYWSAQSGGAVTVELGGYETRSIGTSSCNPDSVFSSEENNAFDGQFSNNDWFGTHDHLLVLTREACGSQSFATVGGDGGEIFSGNGATGVGVTYLLHEFGHNLGFEHADATICENSSSYDAPISAFGFTSKTCPTTEYDDYLDIMGYTVTNATPNLSSPQRILAGWLDDYQTATKATTPIQTVTLSRLGGSSGIQALKIVDPNSDDVYYVEYRAPEGLDKTSAEFRYQQNCGASHGGYEICNLGSSTSAGIVRVLRELPFAEEDASGTSVLATGLVSSSSKLKRHTRLNTGQVFTNYDGGFSLTLNSVSESRGASVTVSFVHPATTTTTISVDPGSQIYGTSDPATVEVAVNASGDDAPAGTVGIYDGSTKVATATVDSDGAAAYTLPPKFKVGSHKLVAKFTPAASSAVKASSSPAATLVVHKLSSTTVMTVRSASVTRHQHEVLTATVATSSTATPTGSIVVYVNGKKYKTFTLTAAEHGTRSLVLPAFKAKGTKSIKLKYLGTSTVAPSTSAGGTVRVPR